MREKKSVTQAKRAGRSLPVAASKKRRQPVFHDYLSKVTETGDWLKDCAAGSRLAFNLIHATHKDMLGVPLGNIVRGVMEHGRFGGIEVGFFSQISKSLTAQVTPRRATVTRDEFDTLLEAARSGETPPALAIWPPLTYEDYDETINENGKSTRVLCW